LTEQKTRIQKEWLLSSYDYYLPENLIAYQPSEKRSSSKLLHIPKNKSEMKHLCFTDIENQLQKGDVLVLNNTKVIPARLLGVRTTGGKVEFLLLKRIEQNLWEALVKPSGRLKKEDVVIFGSEENHLYARLVDDARENSGARLIEFKDENSYEKILQLGHMPLPPYIQREDTDQDKERYQTVFASKEGAVAAPTAGLHFDEALLNRLRNKGVEIVEITLHTGYGTFQPVNHENITEHPMFTESYEITTESAEALNRFRNEKRRIIACGTTTVRTLESAIRRRDLFEAGLFETDIFIYPPFNFKVVQGLITNFHLPKSTLLMLVSAFIGYNELFNAYRIAVEKQYRFYSYGDAMLIL
jgi:S-adenosylmethionine:tRNA ribosyltransferase-isomerase